MNRERFPKSYAFFSFPTNLSQPKLKNVIAQKSAKPMQDPLEFDGKIVKSHLTPFTRHRKSIGRVATFNPSIKQFDWYCATCNNDAFNIELWHKYILHCISTLNNISYIMLVLHGTITIYDCNSFALHIDVGDSYAFSPIISFSSVSILVILKTENWKAKMVCMIVDCSFYLLFPLQIVWCLHLPHRYYSFP